MTYSYDPVMYPELAGGASLGAALGAAGCRGGPRVRRPGLVRGSGEGGCRAGRPQGCGRCCGPGTRLRAHLHQGGHHLRQGEDPDLAGAALAAEGWLAGLGPRELAARWPFVAVDELLLAYEEGNEVEVAWRLVRQEASENWSEVVEAAYARPELAAMFPIFSHGMFRMLRSSRFTSYDVPFLCRGSEGFVLQYTGPVLAEGDADQMVDAYLRWLADHPA